MKPEHTSPIGKYLAMCLGVLTIAAAPVARAQQSDSQKLQDENAALRQQVADLEARLNQTGPATATTTTSSTTTTTAGSPAAATGGEGVTVLSPFEVETTGAQGYLEGNATIGTRVAQPIQETPQYIQVLSSDFLSDTNSQNLTDILKYTATASGDNRFVSDRPTNSATPTLAATIRGFTLNTIERDGNTAAAFSDFNLDNIDRVEVVEGPAAVLYGAGYPGGVINFITKQPQFSRLPTTVDFTFGQNEDRKVVFDTNQSFSDKAAVRVVGAWTNSQGQRHFEFLKNFNITPEIAVSPFKSEKLKITIEDQYMQNSDNFNCNGWLATGSWFNAYYNPSNALMQAAGIVTTTNNGAGLTPQQQYQYRIFNSQANYLGDVVNSIAPGVITGATNNNAGLPVYTNSMLSGAGYYNNTTGQRVKDANFNFHNRGAQVDEDDNIFTMTVAASPTDWLDLHYTYSRSAELFNDVEGNNTPNADGYTFVADSGAVSSGYYNHAENHQGDAVATFEKWGIKNKLFGGFLYQKSIIQYQSGTPVGGSTLTSLFYASTPGATNALGNPGNTYVAIGLQNTNGAAPSFVPVDQVLYSRSGQVLTVAQVYSNWDPAFNVQPDDAALQPFFRTNLDGYILQYNEWYWMDQMAFMHDRLHVMYGYRNQEIRNQGQNLTSNYPYFSPPPNSFAQQGVYNQNVYDYSAAYEQTNFGTFRGSAFQYGATFDITKELTVYVNFSKTFKFNQSYRGGEAAGNVDLTNLITAALQNGGGSYVYLGQTVTSVSQGTAIAVGRGALQPLSNETGYNYEGGIKTSLWDGKLSGTLAFFEGTRSNVSTDDSVAQSNGAEPFNYSTTLFASGSSYYNSRNFRWRTTGQEYVIYGTEFTGVITPIRNFQSVVNIGYLPSAKQTSSLVYTPAYQASSVTNAINYNIIFDSRLANVPKETVSLWNKYTFDTGPARGLSLALGIRYLGARVYSQSMAYNPLNGGLMLPAFWDLDANITYPYEILGYKFKTKIGLYNLTNQTHFGGFDLTPDPLFNWICDTTLSF
jgi:outer membrane receptor for ferric coprogen and ferric-rhodotorulic acid